MYKPTMAPTWPKIQLSFYWTICNKKAPQGGAMTNDQILQ